MGVDEEKKNDIISALMPEEGSSHKKRKRTYEIAIMG